MYNQTTFLLSPQVREDRFPRLPSFVVNSRRIIGYVFDFLGPLVDDSIIAHTRRTEGGQTCSGNDEKNQTRDICLSVIDLADSSWICLPRLANVSLYFLASASLMAQFSARIKRL